MGFVQKHFILVLCSPNFTATGNNSGFKAFSVAYVYWSPIRV